MKRESRYKGILQPRQVGAPKGETPVLLLYDIESDRVRNRVSQVCLDYGLQRIQFSAFFGRLTPNLRQELTMRVLNEVHEDNARVRVMPLTEDSLADMWEYDYWRLDADKLKEEADACEQAREGPIPKLRIVKLIED